MKKAIKTLSALMGVLLVACLSFAVTSCGDDDEPSTTQVYTMGFDEMSSSSFDFMADMNKIENAFKEALGVSGDVSSFTKQGTATQCDKEVREACQKAYDSLAGTTWHGTYTFVVNNVTANTQVAKYTFGE